MTLYNKFTRLIEAFQEATKEKFAYFETKLSLSLFFLFLGFVSGNLFGTFLNFFRHYVVWDGFIMMLSLIWIETVNYASFTPRNRKQKQRQKQRQRPRLSPSLKTRLNRNLIRHLNFYKIGLMLGFFIDAFKVGS